MFESIKYCVLCGTTNRKILSTHSKFRKFVKQKDLANLWSCLMKKLPVFSWASLRWQSISLSRLKQTLQMVSSLITVSFKIRLKMSEMMVDECSTVWLTDISFSICKEENLCECIFRSFLNQSTLLHPIQRVKIVQADQSMRVTKNECLRIQQKRTF